MLKDGETIPGLGGNIYPCSFPTATGFSGLSSYFLPSIMFYLQMENKEGAGIATVGLLLINL
jgi:hypothetical protein